MLKLPIGLVLRICPAGFNVARLIPLACRGTRGLGRRTGTHFAGDNLEMHALTAQGAAATGPVHAVTKTSARHLIQELDGRPAIESLRETLSKTLQKDSRVAELLKNALLIGLRPRGGDDAFLVRQVRGAGIGHLS